MFVEQAIQAEWSDQRLLSPLSLHWLVEHADPGDVRPIDTALTQLRGLLPVEVIAAYAADMSDIANDNGAPAWHDVLHGQITGEEPAPAPEPEPEQPTDAAS